MEHLKVYDHKKLRQEYDGVDRFCRFRVYEQDFQGNVPPPPNGQVYLQDVRSGAVQVTLRADHEESLIEVSAKPGKGWYNPKPTTVGAWSERFYFVWRNREGEEKIILPWNGETRVLYLARVASELAPETLIQPVAGHIYRAKKPRRVPCFGPDEVNDIQILHVGLFSIQYDAPTVRMGKHYPKMDRYAFYAWVGSDVTELYKESVPEGEWAKWNTLKPS